MTFRNRYVFCMAPVDADNQELRSRFRTFAMEFSRHGQVPVDPPGRSVYRPRPGAPTVSPIHRYFSRHGQVGQVQSYIVFPV